ncbi:peptidoglycan DD-metalloendopeptidase family protein [Flavobacterium crassostreae]|uniref:Peptidase M23 n=1 Tax=Flavobacterium crassostreae TaxID=1763534 RepID=A0A1B9E279_9FLAO|nr:peptidoglycan DD-metalloendopeptidase family protein [Flavobacterium crassostreae]OCB76049.1 peptidase M23 [Flavobacterium crassostreae]
MNRLETLLSQTKNVFVLPESIPLDQYTPLNLATSNPKLHNLAINNAAEFENFIEKHIADHHAKVAYGGYNEERNIYQRSTIFKTNDQLERNIHIGMDFWINASTPILSALDGVVHSFKNNSELGDYGPTIILQHQLEERSFYTLYGHLSLESLENLHVGTFFKKGQQLGTLGCAAVNGDYAPHLHFQIIKDIANHEGDYPGVCNKETLNYYLENCPDPNLLLKIKT